MKKVFLFSLTGLILSACSSDEPSTIQPTIDGEPAIEYTASFVDRLPEDSKLEDSYSVEVFALLDKLVPYTSTTHDIEEIEKSIDHFNVTYNLLLATTSAKLEIITTNFIQSNCCTYSVINKKYTPGRYYVTDYESKTWDLVFDVDNSTVYYGFIMKDSQTPTDNYRLILNLNDGSYESRELVSKTGLPASTETDKYSGIFNVTIEPTGMTTLRNADYVFNFHPSTGLLTELEPTYKEIGILDRR